MLPKTSLQEQKNRELDQFRAFQQACGAVPECEPEQPPEPEPDIVLDCADGQIGVELTEIHPSGVEKRWVEREQEFVMSAAKHFYEAAGHPAVHVHIDWMHSPPLLKKTRETSARLLCDLVADHLPSEAERSRDVGDGETLIHRALPIREISVSRASSYMAAEWRDWNFHEVVPPDTEALQTRIAQEEYKIDRCQRTYTSQWLLLVAGAGGPSTWTVIGVSLEGQRFTSRYNRIFLFLMDRKSAVELQLKQRP
jgi:hypothetical protein